MSLALEGTLIALLIWACKTDFESLQIPSIITRTGTVIALFVAALAPDLVLLHSSTPPGFVSWNHGLLRGSTAAETTVLVVSLAVLVLWVLAESGLLAPFRPRRGVLFGCSIAIRRTLRNFGDLKRVAQCAAAALLLGVPTYLCSLQAGPGWLGLSSACIGLGIGMLSLWTIRLSFTALLKREAMGFGDVMLQGMIGAWLGWQASIGAFQWAVAIGLLLAVVTALLPKNGVFDGLRFPLGPPLAAGALVTRYSWQFWGEYQVAWFRNFADLAAEFPLQMVIGLLGFAALSAGVAIVVVKIKQRLIAN